MSLCGDIAKELDVPAHDTSRMHLRLLATTDLHAYLLPYNYYTDTRDDHVGLVRIAGLVAAARADAPNCILLDNGDTLQGAPLGDVAVREMLPRGVPHPMITAMNAIGYDAATLGNHDFDFGLDALEKILSEARFPVVLANVNRSRDGSPFRSGHVILTRGTTDSQGHPQTVRIGVTGVVPPQVAEWNRVVLDDELAFSDTVAAVRREAEEMRRDGADLVVVLAHTGFDDNRPSEDVPPGAENAASAIAALPGVDVVVAGHTHEVRPSEGAEEAGLPGATIVQPGAWGSHLGCIDLVMERRRSDERDAEEIPRWTVVASNTRNIPVTGSANNGASALRHVLRANPELRSEIGGQHRATRHFTSLQIGETTIPLNTFFSFVAPCAATQLVADAQLAAGRDAIAAEPPLRDMRMLSAVAPFRAGGLAGPHHFTDIPAGALRLRHAHDLYCYPNLLAVVRARGRDLRSWLERAASLFKRIDPEDPSPQPLIDHQFAAYNFDRIAGLLYDIDVSRPARTSPSGDRLFETDGRVRNMRYADGTPVGADDEVLVVTNSYRAAGGGHFPSCGTSETILTGTDPVRDHIARYVSAAEGALSPHPSPNFRLCGFGKADVVFETGPGALHHKDRMDELGLALRGDGEDGFLSLTLRH